MRRNHLKLLADIKARLAKIADDERKEQGLSQRDLAKKLGTSQTRISKALTEPEFSSIEFHIRSLLTLGFEIQDIATMIAEA